MITLLAIFIDGFIYASWLFIMATGLTLIYGVMRILNMAHGSFYAIGAYVSASLVGWYFSLNNAPAAGSFAIMVIGALATGMVAGLAVERGVLRFLHGRDEVVMVLVTFGLLLMFEDLIKMIWGVQSYYAYEPYSLLGSTDIDALTFVNYDLAMILVAAIVAIALWWGLNRTRWGKLLRAIVEDREMAIAMGINVNRLFAITFAIGAGLGALAGGLIAPATAVTPGLGIEVIVLAFAVVVTGGLGSIQGALIGAIMIGLSRAAAVNLFPEAELFVIYAVMALVLVFRPRGLFALSNARRI
ncbi:branched-chain amino acid ABC transporter permease [Castellaniella sp. S9]|uniref:branched-chain amino acid ABC transporter permease n=1 Tax=Castellaniella sp. S9 TaxID=2993652 RepID=UPI0022B31D13|nr:branched-chain amino acid ABC transporter permease [Castellaniella sp. S9]